MKHPLQCRCGAVKGTVESKYTGNRGICYCLDCQAFAHFLGREKEVLDERGGTEVVQTLPRAVTFLQGAEKLACMRLTSKGLLRWYTSCCGTPIGNTLATPKVSFIGLVHLCLRNPQAPLDKAFGPLRNWVNVNSARGTPKPKAGGTLPAMVRLIGMMLKARFNGDYRSTPFFRMDAGSPVVVPRILSDDEHAKLMSAVKAS
jgi:hypothetical protein